MEQNREYATFGRHVGYVIATNIAIMLLGIVQIPILTKGLGANLYGVWSLIDVTISLIVPFALISLNVAIVRFLAAEKNLDRVRDDFLSACSVVFITGVALSVLLFLLSDVIATSVFKDVNASYYIKLASVLILVNSLYPLSLAFFRMRRSMGLYSLLTVIFNISQVALIFTSILLGYKLTGVVVAFIINGVVFTLINLIIILKRIGFKAPTFSHMKTYLKWGLPLAPNAAILWVIHTSDRYLVSYFLGVTAAGIYSAAYAIGQYALFALAPLGIVLYPTIAKHYDEGNLNETRAYLKYSVKYLMMLAIPAAFGLSILAKPLLHILTTPQFMSGSSVVPFVAFGAVIFSFFQICVYVIHLVRKTEINVRLLGIAAALNIALNFLLIPKMGITGAAVATLIAYGVLGILTLIVTRRYLKFALSLPFIGKSVAASVIMALCVWLMHPETIAWVIISIILGALIYFAALMLMKGFSKGEISFFINLVKDNLRKIRLIKG
jgi:O-antigen/teichoic acid export membrane protein